MGPENDSVMYKSKISYAHTSGPSSLQRSSSSTPSPEGTRTRFGGGAGGATDFHPLAPVHGAWLLRDPPGAEYMHGLATGLLSVTERKHVVDWLEGRVQDSDRIAPLACAYVISLFFIVKYCC